ncbi:MAG: CTP synthase (UTP-ammonia lyase) [Bacteroidia bacterium]|jgi:CTP synthase (UTP-ammonia lyase)
MKRIALIAEHIEQFEPHETMGQSLEHAAAQLGLTPALDLGPEWLATYSLDISTLKQFDGLWIRPGSPYRNMHNVLKAIHYAREGGIPLLATCGGFQHVVLETMMNQNSYAAIHAGIQS